MTLSVPQFHLFLTFELVFCTHKQNFFYFQRYILYEVEQENYMMKSRPNGHRKSIDLYPACHAIMNNWLFSLTEGLGSISPLFILSSPTIPIFFLFHQLWQLSAQVTSVSPSVLAWCRSESTSILTKYCHWHTVFSISFPLLCPYHTVFVLVQTMPAAAADGLDFMCRNLI